MKKYLAAVSGGPDSMAMLSKYKRKIYVVCHVNYHKRDSSIRDENIVKKFCSENKIKCEVLNVTKKIYHSYKEKNFEHLARNIRYDFFCEIGKKYNIDKLLVAHNEDDFLETALMQKNKKSKTLFLGIKKNSNYK
jgi:tRNA(Ile)-lysidine synthase